MQWIFLVIGLAMGFALGCKLGCEWIKQQWANAVYCFWLIFDALLDVWKLVCFLILLALGLCLMLFFPLWLWLAILMIAAAIIWGAMTLGMLAALLAILIVVIAAAIFGMIPMLLAALAALILAIFGWLLSILGGLWKAIAALTMGASMGIPSCGPSSSEQPARPLVAEQIQPVAPYPPMTQVGESPVIVTVKKGEGTIHATARGGHPLSLTQSIAWTKTQGLQARRVGSYIHAPTLYVGDVLEWHNGSWVLRRPKK